MIETTDVNDIPVLCETIPFFKSVSFGVWIFAGSRDEPDDKSGLFHFLEHLVFKGTEERSTADIAIEIDSLGGHIDAFTSREITCYSGRVVSKRLEQAFDLIADLTLNSIFPEDEIEHERSVILEEMSAVEDSPSDYIYDALYPAVWPGHPLGRLITGMQETIRSITRDDLLGIRQQYYRPPGIVITACGDIKLDQLTSLVEKFFGKLDSCSAQRTLEKPPFNTGKKTISKPTEQAHVIIGADGLGVTHAKRNELAILSTILGGSVSSRLFQNVREKRGLAYSIHSFYDQYLETGLFGVYSACAPEALCNLMEIVENEINIISQTEPSAAEVERAIIQNCDNLRMSFESLGARVSQIAYQKLYFGQTYTLDQMLEEVKSVTPENVLGLAGDLFAKKAFQTIVLGPFDKSGHQQNC